MAHAERIIKSVMLPIGSSTGDTPLSVSTTTISNSSVGASASGATGATANHLEPASASEVSITPLPSTPTGFVMGRISSKAADAFVKSFLQLIPTADLQVLQKVMDMKVHVVDLYIFSYSSFFMPFFNF